jgi:hypothetical protein
LLAIQRWNVHQSLTQPVDFWYPRCQTGVLGGAYDSTMTDGARRQALRLRVDEKRTVAARLCDSGADDELTAQARVAWHWIDDVEKIFLSSVRHRDAAAEAHWLDAAEGAFNIALRKLRDVQEMMEKYNPTTTASA